MKRDNYWKGKFEKQQIEMDEKHGIDLEAIFDNIDENKVPPNMKCLWEQQLMLRHRKENGYRWHPK